MCIVMSEPVPIILRSYVVRTNAQRLVKFTNNSPTVMLRNTRKCMYMYHPFQDDHTRSCVKLNTSMQNNKYRPCADV